MNYMSEYLLIALLVYGINVVPAFMPATWLVLAFFAIKYQLLLIPLVFIGALAAIFGRITLYFLTRKFFHPIFSKKTQKNLLTLGRYINAKKHITIPLFISYAFFPIPSNHVYIAAALAKVHIRLLAISFFIGRLISYSFWISISTIGVKNLNAIFANNFVKPSSLIIELVGFVFVYAVTKINWSKVFKVVRVII